MKRTVVSVFLIVLLSWVTAAAAAGQERLTKEEVAAALAKVKSYGSFDGTWQGSYTIVHGPQNAPDADIKEIQARISIDGEQVSFATKTKDGGWHDIGKNLMFYANELIFKLHALNKGGVWVETWDVVISRESKDSGKLYVMRTVNNWAGKTAGVDNVFSVLGVGGVSRAE